MFSLQNKTAIITGAGSGIGQAIALVFASQGALVHILDLNQEHANDTAARISSAGGQSYAHGCDVSSQQTVKTIFNAIGSTNILINCAGIAHIGRADTTTEEDFERVYSVNIKGVYNCIHEGIGLLKKAGGGIIINISSVAAHVGLSDRFAYSMSKGAVHAMTISVAKDYLHENIRCNSISPARIHTAFVDGFLSKNYPGREKEMFDKLSKSQPLGRMGHVDEVAALALYLASDEASFITGTDFPIDGGFITLNN